MLKAFSKKEDVLFGIVFLIFLFLRIFSDSPYFFIQGSDHAIYLTLANNFPYHTMDNNQLYMLHPPLYPYTIYILTWFFEDYIAGIVVSFLSAVITFFIIYKLVVLLTKERYIAIGALMLFSLSPLYIGLSTTVLKESFSVMLTLAAVYFYILFLKYGKIKNVWLAAFFGALLGVTTDFVIFFILSLFVLYAIFWNKAQKWKPAIPIAATIFSYSAWVLIRLYTYITYEYYPASWDGTIVNTSGWGLMSLISSIHFQDAIAYMPIGVPSGFNFNPLHYIYPIAYMFNLVVAKWPSGLRFSNMLNNLLVPYNLFKISLYMVLAGGAMLGVYKITKSTLKKGLKNNDIIAILVLFIIFLIPLTQKFISIRYTATAVIFLFIIVGYGFFELAKAYKSIKTYKNFIVILIAILIVYLPFYYLEHNYFVLSKEKVVEATKTAEFINHLPGEGVMAQVGYTQELNYLTDKRVVALPMHPDYMFLVDMYNISYLIYGGSYMKPVSNATKEEVFNYETIKYIIEHPEQFRLLKIVEERYPTTDKIDHIYIYEKIAN